MKKYLITGGEGFIGSRIAFLAEGKPYDIKSGSDILDAEYLAGATEKVLGMFHCAAKHSVPESFIKTEEYFLTNVEGTKNVIKAAKATGCKIVFSSSAAVYGESKKRASEADELLPQSPYAEHKKIGETLLRESGIKSIALRYFNVYGPRQSETYAGVIRIFIMNALRGEDIIIYGNGSQIRDFVFVDDVAAANIAAMEYENSSFEIFNIGSGTEISIKELAEMICALTHSSSRIVYKESREGDISYSQADLSKAKKLLGWEARVPLEEGLRQTIEYYKNLE